MEEIKTRINIVYYLDDVNNIQEKNVYQYEKLKILDAENYLRNEGIPFEKVLKVLLEEITLFIPNEEIEKYVYK